MTHGKCKIIHENDAKILLHTSHRNFQHCDIACSEKQLILCKLKLQACYFVLSPIELWQLSDFGDGFNKQQINNIITPRLVRIT